MGLEQERPQQFFIPDKGTGTPGGKSRSELEQALQEAKDKRPLINVISSESKVDSSPPLTQSTSKETKKKKTIKTIKKRG